MPNKKKILTYVGAGAVVLLTAGLVGLLALQIWFNDRFSLSDEDHARIRLHSAQNKIEEDNPRTQAGSTGAVDTLPVRIDDAPAASSVEPVDRFEEFSDTFVFEGIDMQVPDGWQGFLDVEGGVRDLGFVRGPDLFRLTFTTFAADSTPAKHLRYYREGSYSGPVEGYPHVYWNTFAGEAEMCRCDYGPFQKYGLCESGTATNADQEVSVVFQVCVQDDWQFLEVRKRAGDQGAETETAIRDVLEQLARGRGPDFAPPVQAP